MPERIDCSNSGLLPLADFIDYVETKVDRGDAASIADAASRLKAVSNVPDLILPALHQQVRERFSARRVPSTQVVVLGGGSDFYVRADLWPSAAMVASPSHRDDAVLYLVGCDQNYPSLVTSHFGPPLQHDVYAYDPASIIGFDNEPVSLAFKESIVLDSGSAILTLPHDSIVRRQAPRSFSITIALIITRTNGDIHSIDMESMSLLPFSPQLPSTRCSAFFEFAALIGDETTRHHLTEIAGAAPNPRTRLAAYDALAHTDPDDNRRLWESAMRDASPLIQRRAKQELES